MLPLRICRDCGLSAYTREELELFKKDNTCPYNRDNRCKACHNIINKEYKKNNRGKYNSYEAKRRSIKHEVVVSEDEQRRIELMYIVSKELSDISGVDYHVDHIIPLCKGGSHTLDNLQILTAYDNLSKGGR